jgi:hypothetical protein
MLVAPEIFLLWKAENADEDKDASFFVEESVVGAFVPDRSFFLRTCDFCE